MHAHRIIEVVQLNKVAEAKQGSSRSLNKRFCRKIYNWSAERATTAGSVPPFSACKFRSQGVRQELWGNDCQHFLRLLSQSGCLYSPSA